jgi:hypothetical protein
LIHRNIYRTSFEKMPSSVSNHFAMDVLDRTALSSAVRSFSPLLVASRIERQVPDG